MKYIKYILIILLFASCVSKERYEDARYMIRRYDTLAIHLLKENDSLRKELFKPYPMLEKGVADNIYIGADSLNSDTVKFENVGINGIGTRQITNGLSKTNL